MAIAPDRVEITERQARMIRQAGAAALLEGKPPTGPLWLGTLVHAYSVSYAVRDSLEYLITRARMYSDLRAAIETMARLGTLSASEVLALFDEEGHE